MSGYSGCLPYSFPLTLYDGFRLAAPYSSDTR